MFKKNVYALSGLDSYKIGRLHLWPTLSADLRQGSDRGGYGEK